mgnify:CR=1 FL=1
MDPMWERGRIPEKSKVNSGVRLPKVSPGRQGTPVIVMTAGTAGAADELDGGGGAVRK